ncbi:unnamed protein product [Brassica rapa]|uniref:Uncharacterized protein n=1 Tax=Brassica campestris TaxID=3711 RepID=A0A8D9CS97_BRACM|nr:unnamed protein product [Brassica rapa]
MKYSAIASSSFVSIHSLHRLRQLFVDSFHFEEEDQIHQLLWLCYTLEGTKESTISSSSSSSYFWKTLVSHSFRLSGFCLWKRVCSFYSDLWSVQRRMITNIL